MLLCFANSSPDWLEQIGAGIAIGGGPGAPYILQGIGGALGEGATNAQEALASANPFGWVRELFSVNTAARVTGVIVGIALIIIAIAALVLTSDTGKEVISKAAKVAV